MSTEIPFECSCGSVRGWLRPPAPGVGMHVRCHCRDCQAYAHFLGRADEILDEHGGTEIWQVSPVWVEITEGTEHLACMRLSSRGLFRWYAGCCRTPIGNTVLRPRLAFVGMFVMNMVGEPERLAEQIGPVQAKVFCCYAKGTVPGPDAHARGPLSMVLGFFGSLIVRGVRGEHRRSPFLDPSTGRPWVEPEVLTPQQRRELEDVREAWTSRA